jgi:hypothetical protein
VRFFHEPAQFSNVDLFAAGINALNGVSWRAIIARPRIRGGGSVDHGVLRAVSAAA